MCNYGADPVQEVATARMPNRLCLIRAAATQDWMGVRPHEIARKHGNYAALRLLQKLIDHKNNNTTPAPSQLPAFKVALLSAISRACVTT